VQSTWWGEWACECSPTTGEKLGVGCHITHMQRHGATVKQHRQHQW